MSWRVARARFCLKPAEAAFDHVSPPVGGPVEAAERLAAADASVDLVDPFRDRAGDAASSQVGADLAGGVALVRGDAVGLGPGASRARPGDLDPGHDGFELGAVVDVPACDREREGAALAVAGQVDLAGQPAP